MISNTYLCDVCQRPKGEVNRWWIVTVGQALILQAWDSASKEEIEHADYHLCGESHASQILAGWMEKQSRKTIEGEK